MQRLESALCTGEIENLEPKHFACFDAYHSGEFDQALEMATRIFGSESHFDAKAFYLHLICIILEIKYDLPLRAKWMSRWTTLLLDRSSPFATAAKNYHTAVTAYFESHQLDAKSRFKNLAENPDTPARFAALSRFHLGLIHRNENLNGAALIEMHKARELAQTIGHLKLQARITKQITLLSKDIEF
ncbi:MAG: hypothetical protein V4692_14540, partial [Bdellovibrionota bacterium]